MRNALQQLKGQMGEQQGRVKAKESELRQAGNSLEEARKELQSIRAEAFQRLSGGGIGDGNEQPPPAYS